MPGRSRFASDHIGRGFQGGGFHGGLLRCLVIVFLSAVPVLGQEPPSLDLPPADGSFPVAFTLVSSIRELPDGSVLLADRGESQLYVLDWDEDRARPVGRRGEGPGEYLGTGWIYPLAGDSSLFTEGRLGRWHLLEGARIVRTLAHDRPLPSRLGGELGGGDGAGGLLGLAVYWGGGPMQDRYAADSLSVHLVRDLGDGGSAEMEMVAVVPGRGPGFPSARRRDLQNPVRINPLVTETLAVLFLDGWVALVFSDPYAVRWRSPEGEWRGGEPLEEDALPLSEAVACAAVRGWDFRRAPEPCSQEELDAYIWPERAPPFLSQGSHAMNARAAGAAHAAPDGRLLVRRLPSPDRLTEETRYDVIDREGRLAGILRLAANEAIVGVGRHHLYVVSTDAVDLQHLTRHSWP